MVTSTIEARLKTLPAAPGCYLMKDAAGKVLYVGKAAVLRDRVRSYFRAPDQLSPKTAAWSPRLPTLRSSGSEVNWRRSSPRTI